MEQIIILTLGLVLVGALAGGALRHLELGETLVLGLLCLGLQPGQGLQAGQVGGRGGVKPSAGRGGGV